MGEDDVSSLQLRAASRLRARQADSFLDAFDRNEAKSFPWPPAAPQPPPCDVFPTRLPVQRWPPWHRPTKAEYFDELLRANPAGFGAAAQLGGTEQEMML